MEWFTPEEVYDIFEEEKDGRVWSDKACEFLSHKYNDDDDEWRDEDEAKEHMLGWWELDRNGNIYQLERAVKFFKSQGYIGWYAGGFWSGPSTVELFDRLVERTQNLNAEYMIKFSPTHILLRAGGTAYDNCPLF